MKKNLVYFFLISFLFACENGGSGSGNRSYSTSSEPSYEEKVMSVEQEEQMNPLDFLTTDGTYRKNLLGEWVCEGTITNYATVAVYKDVRIRLSFYSKTETLMGTEDHIVYEYVNPGRSKSFKIKTYANGVGGKPKTLGWEIIDAGVSY